MSAIPKLHPIRESEPMDDVLLKIEKAMHERGGVFDFAGVVVYADEVEREDPNGFMNMEKMVTVQHFQNGQQVYERFWDLHGALRRAAELL